MFEELLCGVVSGLNALIFCGDVNCCDFLAAQHRESALAPAASKSCATSLILLHRGSGGVVETNRPPEEPTYSTFPLELLLGLCRTTGMLGVGMVWDKVLEVELTERMEAEEERLVEEIGEEEVALYTPGQQRTVREGL